MIESSSFLLFQRGFTKIATDITFANIDDLVFCQKTSYIHRIIWNSLKYSGDMIQFFSEMRDFDLLSILLSKHYSNKEICHNSIFVLDNILIHSKDIKISSESLNHFLKSGVLDIIYSFIEKSDNGFLVALCKNTFSIIHKKGKL